MGSVKRLDSYYTVSEGFEQTPQSDIDFSQISDALPCGNCRFNKIQLRL